MALTATLSGQGPRPHLGQHIAAVAMHCVWPLVKGGEVGAPQHGAGAGARTLLAVPPALGAGAKNRERPWAGRPGGSTARPAGRPARPAQSRPISVRLCPGPTWEGRPAPGPAPRGAVPGGTGGRSWGPTSWCSLWSRQPPECRSPRCTRRHTGTRGCSRSGRCHQAPSLQERAGHVAGGRLCPPSERVQGTGPLSLVSLLPRGSGTPLARSEGPSFQGPA